MSSNDDTHAKNESTSLYFAELLSEWAGMLGIQHKNLAVGAGRDARHAPASTDITGAAVAANHHALAAAAGIFLDWDGCLVVGNRILPAARHLLACHADKVAIVSNNSTHRPEQFSEFLAQAGLSVPPARIILAGAEAITWVAGSDAGRVMLFGSPQMRALAIDRGVDVVREDPDLVLLMRDKRFGYNQLSRAASALARGARLVAANADRSHPGIDGDIVPETGALLAALTTCVPGIVPVVIGKPHPLLFMRACEALKVESGQAIMIGDNAETDIAGAEAFGIASLHVSPKALERPDLLVPIG